MPGDGFVEVGRTADFPKNRGRAVDLDGKKVAVIRVEDRWFAIQDSCPHMGASLGLPFCLAVSAISSTGAAVSASSKNIS